MLGKIKEGTVVAVAGERPGMLVGEGLTSSVFVSLFCETSSCGVAIGWGDTSGSSEQAIVTATIADRISTISERDAMVLPVSEGRKFIWSCSNLSHINVCLVGSSIVVGTLVLSDRVPAVAF